MSFYIGSHLGPLIHRSIKLTRHDPSRNAMILHDQSSNQFQLVQTPQSCPHCGQPISTALRRGLDLLNNRLNRNYTYVNNNYFKLLSNASNVDERNGSFDFEPPKLTDASYDRLPENLFTQNYFSKFFAVEQLLGRGSNATVYKVEHFINKFSLGYFAVKKIAIGNDLQGLSRILKEVELLCLLSTSSKNLVKYNHVWLEISRVSEFGPEVPCAFILTEYCDGGNLESLVLNLKTPKLDIEEEKQRIRELRRRRRAGNSSPDIPKKEPRFLSELEILKFFKDIVIGVYELHSHHIIHRDLKPSNCLVSSRYESDTFGLQDGYNEDIYEHFRTLPSILVSDFGESQFEGKIRNSTGVTGTLEFLAPELLSPKDGKDMKSLNDFSKETDIFGLGMILFFMCFGEIPYSSSTDGDYSDLKHQIKYFDINDYLDSQRFRERLYRSDLLDGIYDLLRMVLNRSPRKRPHTEELAKIVDLLLKKILSGHDQIDLGMQIKNDVEVFKHPPEMSSDPVLWKEFSYKLGLLCLEVSTVKYLFENCYTNMEGYWGLKLLLLDVFCIGMSATLSFKLAVQLFFGIVLFNMACLWLF